MSVKNQAVSGMMWNAIERFSSQGMQFILTIIIARLLSPDDYGLVAMLSIFMSIAQTIVDSGLSNALIQKKDRTEIDYNTMFYSNIVTSIFVYGLLFISAPWIAEFYNQPELVKVTRVFGISLITNSFGVIQMTRLTIALDFKKLAFAALLSVVVSGSLGLWMAYHGFGVWTLVFQTIIGNLSWVVILWSLVKWIPRWCFSWNSFHTLFSYGSKLLFSSLLHTLYTNMYSLVVGKYYSASILGYFNRAYTLGQFPVQNFSNIVQKVLYPIQCCYQSENEKFNQIFINYLSISSFVLFPLMIGFSVLATPIITLLLTEKWLPTVPLLQIMCMSMMWYPIMQANVLVLDAKGRSDYHLQSEIVKKLLAIIVLFSAIPFGIRGVCLAMVVYSLIDMFIVVAYSRRLTGIGYKLQFKIMAPSLSLALCMGGIVWLIVYNIESSILKIVIGSFFGLLFYVGIAYLLKLTEFKILLSFFAKKNDFYQPSI